MTILQSIVFGIVEGATEFLPVSSTGHLILASSLIGVLQSEFVKTFEIVIQLGAILAVVVLYWRSFCNSALLKKLIVAFIPTGIIGLAFYHILKTYLLGNNLVVLLALGIGGVVIIALEYIFGRSENVAPAVPPAAIGYGQAAVIGCAQAVAIIPGVSRSAATIMGGMALGIARPTIVEFSFLLAVPTMLAATGLDLIETSTAFTNSEWFTLAIGFTVSFVVALAAIRWLLDYVRRHSFTSFGIYRILLALAFAVFFFV